MNQTTPNGALISWHIPDAQFIDGAVLSIFDKAKIGQGPIKTLHLRKNETFKFVDGLDFETKYRASLYAVRGENTTPKKEASFRTDIEITPVKECMVTTYDETMVRGNFQYDIMKRKPNIIVRLESKEGLFTRKCKRFARQRQMWDFSTTFRFRWLKINIISNHLFAVYFENSEPLLEVYFLRQYLWHPPSKMKRRMLQGLRRHKIKLNLRLTHFKLYLIDQKAHFSSFEYF